MADMTDRAINWIHQQKSLMPDNPSSCTSPPARRTPRTTSPRSGPTSTRARSTGLGSTPRGDLRAAEALGVIPADAELTRRRDEIPAWDDMAEALKPVLIRQMELYAGFLEYTDYHVGRLLDALPDLGHPRRHAHLLHRRRQRRLGRRNPQWHLQRDDQLQWGGRPRNAGVHDRPWTIFGGPESYNHYAVGWAHAMDTPYQWTKQVASHFGGTRNGTIVHWPKRYKVEGEIRTQFTHIIDVAPTILEAAGLPEPNIRERRPADAPARASAWVTRSTRLTHRTSTRRSTSRCSATAASTTRADRGHPPRSRGSFRRGDAGLRRRPLGAVRHDDRLEAGPRLATDIPTSSTSCSGCGSSRPPVRGAAAGRPGRGAAQPRARRASRAHQGNSQLLFGGMGRLSESSVINIKNRSHSVTAEIVVGEAGAHGVIVAQGGSIGGWGLVCHRRYPEIRLQPARPPVVHGRRSPTSPSRAARIRCGWSSPMTAAAWPRAARSPSSSTGHRSARDASRPRQR